MYSDMSISRQRVQESRVERRRQPMPRCPCPALASVKLGKPRMGANGKRLATAIQCQCVRVRIRVLQSPAAQSLALILGQASIKEVKVKMLWARPPFSSAVVVCCRRRCQRPDSKPIASLLLTIYWENSKWRWGMRQRVAASQLLLLLLLVAATPTSRQP